MKLFHEVPDTQAIMLTRGAYRQVPVYYRGERVYVKYGSGFVRLMAHGGTSCPNVRWDDMEQHDKIVRGVGKFSEPVWKGPQ